MARLLSIFIVLMAVAIQSKATHLTGGVITYEYVSDSVYDVTLLYYRNCNGVALTNPSSKTYLHCITTGSKIALTLKRESIQEVTYICDNASRRCYPSNTRGTGKGLEEHKYTVRIDFRTSAFKPYYTCGQLVVQTEQCCRTSSMTTGLGNTRYFNYSAFNVTDSLKNSSPNFNNPPQGLFGCNYASYLDVSATDKDGDSLSYHLTNPLEGWNNTAAYSSGYSARRPLQVFGTTINPNTIPPSGFYFDSTIGHVIFTPTRCNEVSAMVVTVKEWRKNSKGVYEHIGSINREIQLETAVWSGNNIPTIRSASNYSVCEGEKLAFNITTDDARVWPAPADSVKLSWNNPIKGATYKILNTKALHQSLRVEWTPPTGSATTVPYTFIVTATDDHCPYPGRSSRAISVTVNKPLGTSTSISSPYCGKYIVEGTYDTSEVKSPSYLWYLLDTSGSVVTDTNVVLFGADTSTGFGQTDTFTIKKTGTYVVVSQIEKTDRCTGYAYDTIYSIGETNLILPTDTLLCQNDSFTFEFRDTLKDLVSSQNWKLNTHTDTSSRYTNTIASGTSVLKVTAHGVDGCIQHDSVELTTIYKPVLEKLEDTVYCKPTGRPIFVAFDNLDSGKVVNAFMWSTGATKDSVSIDSTGAYWVKASNRCGYDSVSFKVLFDLPYVIDLGVNKQVCDSDSVFIGDSIAHPLVRYQWNTGDTSSSIYVKQNGTYSVRVTNGCSSVQDSIDIQFDVSPSSIQWTDTLHFCDTINTLLDALNPGASYKWHDGSTTQTKTITSSGLKWVEVISKHCGKFRDSSVMVMHYSPRIDFTEDSIVYCDSINDLYDAKNEGATYVWDDGSTNQTKRITALGWHSVRVISARCGSAQDSIFADLVRTPVVYLGNDTTVKPPISIVLDAENTGSTYFWNTGETSQTISIDTAGTYWVQVTNVCGTDTDSITIASTIGLQTLVRLANVHIIPNPSNGVFQLSGDIYDIQHLSIFDVLGREMDFSATSNVRYTLHDPKPGVYLVYIQKESATVLRRLVIE